MDLKEELARQSLLLEFIADCVGLGTIPDLAKLITSRLHWTCNYDTCSVLLPESQALTLWSSDRRTNRSRDVDDPELMRVHRALLGSAMASNLPSVGDPKTRPAFFIALPLGTGEDALGALCLSRTSSGFSHNDVRHLQHACNAVGGALTRIAAVMAEHAADQIAKSAESALRLAAEDRALLAEQMIGIVSHDLRNPLSAILMGVALMGKGDALPTHKTRVLEKVHGAARRAQRLVEDLLDFTQARVGSGLALKMRKVDMDRFMTLTVDELNLSFPAMELRRAGDRLGEAYLDPDRIQQMLGNLVANAATYGAKGHPIELASAVADGWLTFSVRNEGDPIPSGFMDRMFEPMVRGSESGHENRSVGLGLYVVRAIAQGHQGKVQVTSDTIDGTRFVVQIPV